MIAGCVVFAVLVAGQVGATEPAPSVPTVAVESVVPHINTEVLVEKRDGVFVAGLLESVSRTELVLRLADGRSLALALADVASVRPKTAPPAAAQTPAAAMKPGKGATLGYDQPRKGPPARLLELLLRKQVVVFTTEDVTVHGRLVSFDDDSILVESRRGEFEIELSAIKRIEESDSERREASSHRGDAPESRSPAASAASRDVAAHAETAQGWFVGGAISAAAGAALCGVWLFVCATPYVAVPAAVLLGAGVVAGGIGALELGAASAAEKRAAAEEPRMRY